MSDRRRQEWLEADGLGGFASGTASGIRTRRYHALLLAASTPPTGRFVLVNGLDARVTLDSATVALSSQCYTPEVIEPDGESRIESFSSEPWPRWRYRLPDGRVIEHEIFVRKGSPLVCLSWSLVGEAKAGRAELIVRPFFSGRDYHALQRENAGFSFTATAVEHGHRWQSYEGVPGVVALSNGEFREAPAWYLNFLYSEERARGLDHIEDLASPGELSFDLSRGPALLVFTTEDEHAARGPIESIEALHAELKRAEETRRAAFAGPLERAADAYLVKRGRGLSLIAGYPWFADWGRDTFIALRGLCLTTHRLPETRQILLEWSGLVSDGMLPNRFPDSGDQPEYNSVDASLWFVIAVGEFVRAWQADRGPLPAADHAPLANAVTEILNGYARGTRYGIRLDRDGLLASGQPGVQLTWMDAKVGDWVVTPRTGKAVEVQALWLNALRIGCDLLATSGKASQLDAWRECYVLGVQSFQRRFWFEDGGYLFDVVDVEHRAGTEDATFRPNQIFAAGGLPIPLLDGDRARRVVEEVESRLWTPLGLRTLAPGEPRYRAHYEGNVRDRDGAYHQGTAWAWLLGPFIEAWVRVWGGTEESKLEARRRFLAPLRRHLDEAGLGHVSEIADGDPPHTPRGCPFQAWSLGELLRIEAFLAPAGRPELEPAVSGIQRAPSGAA